MKALNNKRSLTLIIIFAVMMVAFAFLTADANTSVEYKIDIPKTLYHNKNFDESPVLWAVPVNGNFDENGVYIDDQAAITAKSSNPKVIKLVKNDGLYEMILKKSGKSRITMTFKDEEGNTRTLSKVFRVIKYPNFIKSLHISGKKMNIKEDIKASEIYTKKTKATVKFVLKNGWKKTEITGRYCKKNGNQVKIPDAELKRALKGKSFKFPKKYKKMYMFIKLEKGDDYLDYLVEINRK